MSATARVICGGSEITVRELTVIEVRDWLKGIEAGTTAIDPAGDALFADVSLADIALMSDAPAEWLAQFGPSVIEPLAELCKKMNPHFFRLRTVVQAAHIAQVRALLSGQPETIPSATP